MKEHEQASEGILMTSAYYRSPAFLKFLAKSVYKLMGNYRRMLEFLNYFEPMGKDKLQDFKYQQT